METVAIKIHLQHTSQTGIRSTTLKSQIGQTYSKQRRINQPWRSSLSSGRKGNRQGLRSLHRSDHRCPLPSEKSRKQVENIVIEHPDRTFEEFSHNGFVRHQRWRRKATSWTKLNQWSTRKSFSTIRWRRTITYIISTRPYHHQKAPTTN